MSYDLDVSRAPQNHRDTVLDILSDAQVAAPIVQTANFHSKANPSSYFYVFSHNSMSGEYAAVSIISWDFVLTVEVRWVVIQGSISAREIKVGSRPRARTVLVYSQ